MDELHALRLEVADLRRAVASILSRGSLSGGVFAGYMGGSYGDVDRLLPYGYASTPTDGCEVAARINGDHAWVVGDLHAGRPATGKGAWTLYDRHGHTVSSGTAGIVVDAGSDTLDVDATTIEVDGTVVTVAAGATLTLRGGLVKITGTTGIYLNAVVGHAKTAHVLVLDPITALPVPAVGLFATAP